jgi:mono/diheme cytochrome c family protein
MRFKLVISMFAVAGMSMCLLGNHVAVGGEIPEVNPLSGNDKAINSGRTWFRSVCAVCHGGRADGAGERGNGADLRKFDKGFERFVETVKKGKEVPGRTQSMPAWGGVLDDKTIYEIGAYLETLAMDGADWKQGAKQ